MIDKKVRTVGFHTREKKRAWWRRVSLPKPGFDVVTISCVILLLTHLIVELGGGVAYWWNLYHTLGLSIEGIQAGEVWQMFTYSLLHGSWVHVVANVILLWLIGGRVQAIIGQKRLALTLVVGAVFGGVLHLVSNMLTGPDGWRLLVGSSGAVFAVLMLLTMLSPDSRMFPFFVSGRNFGIGIIVASLGLALMQPSLGLPGLSEAGIWFKNMGMKSVFDISHACHLGGCLAGMLMARTVLGKTITLEDLRRERMRRESGKS